MDSTADLMSEAVAVRASDLTTGSFQNPNPQTSTSLKDCGGKWKILVIALSAALRNFLGMWYICMR